MYLALKVLKYITRERSEQQNNAKPSMMGRKFSKINYHPKMELSWTCAQRLQPEGKRILEQQKTSDIWRRTLKREGRQ